MMKARIALAWVMVAGIGQAACYGADGLVVRVQLVQRQGTAKESRGGPATRPASASLALDILVKVGDPFYAKATLGGKTLVARGTVRSGEGNLVRIHLAVEESAGDTSARSAGGGLSQRRIEQNIEVRVGEEVEVGGLQGDGASEVWKVGVRPAGEEQKG